MRRVPRVLPAAVGEGGRRALEMDVAVVRKADEEAGEVPKAYVVLKPGRAAQRELETEIVEVVKTHVGRHQYPREIEFLDQLPKTETGKIQRFLLRGR